MKDLLQSFKPYETMRTKINKYSYLNVIQQNYGHGWEDVSQYEADSNGYCKERTIKDIPSRRTGGTIKRSISNCTLDYHEYCLTGYLTRVIFRKELNQAAEARATA